MFEFQYLDDSSKPMYQTEFSAACDLKARTEVCLRPGKVEKVPTGIKISRIIWDLVPEGAIPELQIRARSGLAFREQISLPNGVGTIDADYREEIAVLLVKNSPQEYVIRRGERIAQMVLSLTYRLPDLQVGDQRVSGFGSTGK